VSCFDFAQHDNGAKLKLGTPDFIERVLFRKRYADKAKRFAAIL